MTLLLCCLCALGGFVVGMLCGCVLCALFVGKGLMSLAQHKGDELAKQGAAILSGHHVTISAQTQTPTMTSTWHPGASTN